MKPLTQAEEEIMQILWHLEKAFVKEIVLKSMMNQSPPTIPSPLLLESWRRKDLWDMKQFGKSHRYYPFD